MPSRIRRPLGAAVAIASLCLLLGAASAGASTIRFAGPGGNGPGNGPAPCPQSNPCSLFEAAAINAADRPAVGDEVVVLPGEYSDATGDFGPENSVSMQPGIRLHAAAGQARPLLVSSHAHPLVLLGGDSVSGLEIRVEGAGGPSGIRTTTDGGVGTLPIIDDMIVISPVAACELLEKGAILRNSVCLATGKGAANSSALEAVSTGGGAATFTLRNVTAINLGANSVGLKVGALENTPTTVDAKSVIVRGSKQDVQVATSGANASANVNLENSDFAQTEASGSGTAAITDPTTHANVTAPPLLAADEYHELPGSPTIDKGILDAQSDALAIDGQPRALGIAPDIGADEFLSPALPSITMLSCSPVSLIVGGAPAKCLATVSGTAQISPTGAVKLSSDAKGTFSDAAGCMLAPVGAGKASCQLTYAPSAVGSGSHKLTAAYQGDSAHLTSEGSTQVKVSSAKAPNTLLRKKPRTKTASHRATFTFLSSQPGSTFQCKLDKRPFKACRSPFKAQKLKTGRHVLRVRAINSAGTADPGPAVYKWTVS